MAKHLLFKEPAAATRRERRKQEFRERILDAAIELFEQHGCEAPTLDDICRNADVSRPTFYKYYPSKKELINALGETLWLNMARDLTETCLQRQDTIPDFIQAFFDLVRTEFAKYNTLERELIRQSMSSDRSDGHYVGILKGLTALFETVYREGKKRGEVSEGYPCDFLAEMTMGAINSVMMHWAVDDNYPLHTRLDQLSDYIPRMLTLKP